MGYIWFVIVTLNHTASFTCNLTLHELVSNKILGYLGSEFIKESAKTLKVFFFFFKSVRLWSLLNLKLTNSFLRA